MSFINNYRFGVFTGLGTVKQVIKNVMVANWVLSGTEYATQVTHNLDTDNLLVSIYKDDIHLSMNNIQILNTNTIQIFNDTAINCKVILIAKE